MTKAQIRRPGGDEFFYKSILKEVAMKVRFMLVLVALVALIASSVSAQTITSNGTGGGAWSSTATWAGGVVPTGAHKVVVAATDSVVFDVAVTMSDTLLKQSAKRDSIGASGSLTFGSTGVYQHDVNGGSIPLATWQTGSTCLLTGITSSMPSNTLQNFFNLTVNCPNYTGNLNLGWQKGTVTMGGTLTVTNIGYTHASFSTPNNQLRLFGGSGSCTVNNIVINGFGGQLTPMGSSYTDTIFIPGNITISGGGALFLANNSSASGIFMLKGNLAIVDSGFVAKSNNANLSKIVFSGTGTQTFTRPSVLSSTDALLGATNLEVAGGSTLSFPGTKDTLTGSGSFKLDSLATMICNHPLGINGVVHMSGSNGGGNSLSTYANFTFSGSSAQVTGTMMPATVRNLTINNASGVKLTQATTINGVLNLVAGKFDVGVGYTLGPAGTITTGSGSLTAVESRNSGSTAFTFSLNQNYPNPFNPSTVIGYQLAKSSSVKVTIYDILGNEVVQLVNGVQSAGYHSVTFNARNLASGMYFYKIQASNFIQTKKMVLLK